MLKKQLAVLLIEDDPDYVPLVESWLSNCSEAEFTVIWTDTLLTGLQRLAGGGIDAILLDLQMPDVDGYTAAQRIRAAETPGRRTPIIALTASLARGTRERCLAAGIDEQLNKPLDLGKFSRLVRALTSPSTTNPA